METIRPEERIVELGLELPPAPAPVALYDPVVRSGPWLWVSGQLPIRDGKIQYRGKIGADLDAEQGAGAARLCALNAVAQVRKALGSLDVVERIVQLSVYVNSAPGFRDQPAVANGASAAFTDIFGEAGRHSRAAVGVSELPLDAAVEIVLVVAVETDDAPRGTDSDG